MPFIKELVIHGFKSFARETKIPFRNTMNTIVGPNGSGKSNVTDAICFVLGRMSGKSMRAKKLSNLIFAGTNQYKPAAEASVEMIFDNTDKGFSLNEPEVSIKRILRKNGAGVYKINGEIKTRQEVLELLAQAGIDPNGFNIVLQGEIDAFVKMSPEERREVIEEVAGISIYEMRKKHSLQELDKTEARLKETNAILRERNSYLKNLEEERKQAIHFKKLQEDVRSYKASIAFKMINEKQEKLNEINESITKEQDAIAKLNLLIDKNNQEVAILNEKINHITLNIQKSSGLEQERLNSEISDLRAEMAGLLIKKQNHESSIADMAKRKEDLELMIQNAEREIVENSKSKGKSVKHELDIKKKQLEEIEEQKRKLYQLKNTVSAINSRIEEKQIQVHKIKVEYEFAYNKIKQLESELIIKDNLELHREKIVVLRTELEKTRKDIDALNKVKIESEKQIAVLGQAIDNQIKIQSQVSSLDVCPLCKTKITKEHVGHVVEEAEAEKTKNTKEIDRLYKEIKDISEKSIRATDVLRKIEDELKVRSQDVLRLELINEKKEICRRYSEDLKLQEKENSELTKKRDSLENQISSIKTSESNIDSLRLEIQELERHEESNLGMELTLKQRDIERNKNILKQITREIIDNTRALEEINNLIEEKQQMIDSKNDQDKMLKEKFRKTLEEKAKHQERIHFFERDMLHKQNEKHLSEDRINNFKIERAQFLAQKEAIEQDSAEFKGAKLIKMSIEELRKKIEETQIIIAKIGTVNMKALEVYDDVRKEYEKVQEKVNIILSEKEEILKVIEDIDKKKKKAFMETMEKINELFSRNFSQLSDKGIATLEPADKEKLFEAGVEMLIKVGKGKYFDTHSLSGGEKSLISLALIFAIQEYKPYCFYIFDEIDAALDRRNSERLAMLLKRYINRGQYIIITHNDSLITESPVIYGVSMQDKISKVISLEV
ncbi:MAG: chromosome segregation SMC family protein [Nanoarchaeota archaeon]